MIQMGADAWIQNDASDFLHLLKTPSLTTLDLETTLNQTPMPIPNLPSDEDDPLFYSSLDLSASSLDNTIPRNIPTTHHDVTAYMDKKETSTMVIPPCPVPADDPNTQLYEIEKILNANSGASLGRKFYHEQSTENPPLSVCQAAKGTGKVGRGLESNSRCITSQFSHAISHGSCNDTKNNEDSPPYIMLSTAWRNKMHRHPSKHYSRGTRISGQSKRISHGQAEKDYRERLSRRFKELSLALEYSLTMKPSTLGSADSIQMLSKAEILTLATERLLHLRRENEALVIELSRLQAFLVH